MIEGKKHIMHVFDGFRIGGTEVRTCQIINSIGAKYRHTICSLTGNFDAKVYLKSDIKIDFIHPEFVNFNIFFKILHIRAYLNKVKPDLLITYAWGAVEWAIANSFLKICPDIRAIEGFSDDEIYKEKKHRLIIRKLFYPRCSKLVTCSDNLRKRALSKWNIKPEKAVHFSNGIDVSKFGNSNPRKKNEKIIIGNVASLIKLKNHMQLIKIFSQLPDDLNVVLKIIGEGPERGNLEQYIHKKELSKKVQLCGYIKNPSALFKKFDIFCLSSDTEQMPIAVLEAMASGLPIVSTDVGDIKMMVDNENSEYIVEPDNSEKYLASLLELLTDYKLRQRLGDKNLKKCKKYFSLDNMIDNYYNLYELLMD